MLTLAKIKQLSWLHSRGWAMEVRLSVDSTTYLLFSLHSTTKNWAKSMSTFKSSNLYSQKVSLLGHKNDVFFHFGYFRGCLIILKCIKYIDGAFIIQNALIWLMITIYRPAWLLSLHQLFVNNNSLILRSIPMPLMSWIDNSPIRWNFKHSWQSW